MFNPLSSLVPPSPSEDALLAAVALSLLLRPLLGMKGTINCTEDVVRSPVT